MRNNVINGFGRFIYYNGSCRIGWWVNGKAHGNGISYDIYGHCQNDGWWEHGMYT